MKKIILRIISNLLVFSILSTIITVLPTSAALRSTMSITMTSSATPLKPVTLSFRRLRFNRLSSRMYGTAKRTAEW